MGANLSKIIIGLFLLLSLAKVQAKSKNSLITAEIYLGFGLGFSEFDETLSSSELVDHNATIYSGALGARLGLNLLGLVVGGIGEMSSNHWDGKRADQGGLLPGQSNRYDSTQNETLYGAFAGIQAGILRLWGEYYPETKASVSYYDEDGSNPFLENDTLYGEGYGVGIGVKRQNIFAGLVLRQINYKEMERQGTRQALGEYSLTQIKNQSGHIQIGIGF